jgi:hypothetical protein
MAGKIEFALVVRCLNCSGRIRDSDKPIFGKQEPKFQALAHRGRRFAAPSRTPLVLLGNGRPPAHRRERFDLPPWEPERAADLCHAAKESMLDAGFHVCDAHDKVVPNRIC